jgi:purine-binding chemotaxis protein CheW
LSAATNDGARADPIVELCAFRVGDEEYVIDIRRIREIVQPLPVTAVPRAPEWMDGVVNLRGEVVPVLDVRRRLGLPQRLPSRRTKLLIVHVGGRVVALVVDAVSEVVRIPRSEIDPPPAMDAGGVRLFLGVCGARGTQAAAAARAAAAAVAGARGAEPRAPAPQRLRLLLNVKALLEPAARPRARGDGVGEA